MHIRRHLFLLKKRFWAGIFLAQFLLFYIASKSKVAIDAAGRFFEKRKNWQKSLFADVPFSVGDVLYILMGLMLIFALVLLFKKNFRAKALLFLLVTVNGFYFIYQILWGLMYFQPPLSEKLPGGDISEAETKTLVLKYLALCKNTRETTSEDGNGVFRISSIPKVEQEILQNQNKLPSFLLSKKKTQVINLKPSLFRRVMSDTGILGYYNPFTAEAQYNPEVPATHLPITLAHESAHQLGYAREQEANFIGYLAGIDSQNADLRYSTELFALKSLLNSLQQDSVFVKKILAQYSPKMKRDRKFEKEFVKKHSGVLDAFFGFTNDLFLKSNQQQGSVTYSYFTELLIRYERTKTGRPSSKNVTKKPGENRVF